MVDINLLTLFTYTLLSMIVGIANLKSVSLLMCYSLVGDC